ncbi:MAG: hypothetical protein SF187_07790 [Deltaproteobacteria bacterium]|nr:hypothetical protein [Deltaproteobacteria bacterium]
MQGCVPSPHPSRPPRPALCLAASLLVASLFAGSCRKSSPFTGETTEATPASLLGARAVASGLIARGGAEINATTHFRIVPTQADGLMGEQDITTNTVVRLGGDGHYSLHEENNHDGGRDVFFTGDEIAVKLRYGKLIKRPVRPPEPMQVLEQGLGGPAAAWEVFREYAQIQSGEATDTITVNLASTKSEDETPRPSSPLVDWRKTAVPTELKGKLRYLRATASAPAVLVAAELTGRFTARTTTAGKVHEVQGSIQITFAARDVGKATAEGMPAEAETAWMRQRTILEERALLETAGAAKAGLPP